MRNHLPKDVFRAIYEHLKTAGNTAHSAWEAGSADEDTLTGYLGASLERPWSDWIETEKGNWRWRIRHKKFRGRGSGAFERKSGADGILQIEIRSESPAPIIQKGILFQAKKGDLRKDNRLVDQAELMEELAPSGSAILNYNAERYECIASVPYLQNRASSAIVSLDGRMPMGEFLAERFLPCKVGLQGLYYDAHRKVIVVPEISGETRLIPLELSHRVTIQVIHSE